MSTVPIASDFNPLPHTRENLSLFCVVLWWWNFNPLPHTRENDIPKLIKSIKNKFQSTPSYEGELLSRVIVDCLGSDFNPLPHTRENYSITFIHLRTIYFNPLPHTRENFIKQPKQLKPTISIHSLIRGRTAGQAYGGNSSIISIHSLIRGRTQSSFGYAGSLAFQSTPSYEGELYCRSDRLLFRYFNPLPHTRENTSVNWHSLPDSISIHSLIRGRTLSSIINHLFISYFNPLPHTRENAAELKNL